MGFKASTKFRRRAALLFGGFLLLIVIYAAVRLAAANAAVASINNSLMQIKSANLSANPKVLRSSFANISLQVSTIDDVTHDPLITALGSLPFINKDFSAVADVSSNARKLCGEAQPVIDLLTSVSESSSGNALSNITPSEAALLAVQTGELETSLGQALASLNAHIRAGLDFGLEPKFESLQAQLSSAQIGLQRARPLMALALPVVSSSKTWFIANENLAEARGTGGILGSWAIIKVNQGTIKLLASGSDQDLDKMVKVKFNALPAQLRNVWGVEPSNWRDVNAARHFGYFAQQIADSLEPKIRIDGVLSIGQGTVARLLSATGPITVSGTEINDANAHDFLAKGIYAKYVNVDTKNAFVQKLMLNIFRTISTKKLDVKAFWQSLLTQEYGDQPYGWSSDAKTQRLFELGGVSGEVSTGFGPKVYFTQNNAGANKLDAYMHLSADYSLGRCSVMTDNGFAGRQAKFVLRLNNLAPRGLPDYVSPGHPTYFGVPIKVSTNRTIVSIYGPVGASRQDFTLDGKPIFAKEAVERDRPVWVLDISVEPNKPRELVLNWVEPIEDADQKDIQSAPEVVAPSTFNAVNIKTSSSGFCQTNRG